MYFKHMSYGGLTRILLENNTILNKFISPYNKPYWLMLTYVNNTSKMIYGNDSIVSNYVNWSKSKTHLCIGATRQVFLVVNNMGSEFFIELHSRMNNGVQSCLINYFFKPNFKV